MEELFLRNSECETIELADEFGMKYQIKLSKSNAQRALTDMTYATSLLNGLVQEGSSHGVFDTDVPPTDANLSSEPGISAVDDSGETTPLEESVKFDENLDSSGSSDVDVSDNNANKADSNKPYSWTEGTIKMLIVLFKEQSEKDNDAPSLRKSRKLNFWSKVSKLMLEKGYKVSGRKCFSKWFSLLRKYKEVKDHNSKSGNSRKPWSFLIE